jgi:PKD repeat protein
VKTTVSATAGVLGSGTSSSGTATTAPSVVVDISAAPTVTMTPPTTIPTIGQLATFNVVVTPATGGSAITDVTINFDSAQSSTVQDLGALTTSSSGISISHSYESAGSYVVTLSVTDASGQTIQTKVPVTVSGAITVTISGPTSATHGGAASFTTQVPNLSRGVQVETYTWDFGDGTTQTGSSSASHTFAVAGTYTVKVTVTTSDGSTGVASMQIVVS